MWKERKGIYDLQLIPKGQITNTEWWKWRSYFKLQIIGSEPKVGIGSGYWRVLSPQGMGHGSHLMKEINIEMEDSNFHPWSSIDAIE